MAASASTGVTVDYSPTQIPEPPVATFLFADTRMAVVWLIIRLYAGWEWLTAGWAKFNDPNWTGAGAGTALSGFVNGALSKTSGPHPDVNDTYAAFLQSFVLPHASFWSWAITLGELAVGLGLIVGLLTGVAAFFGGLMNINYLFAGTVSTNPLLFVLATWLVLAWRVAGWWGLDRWFLPLLGTPWWRGSMRKPEPQAGGTPQQPTPETRAA
jgi:thiosulfate dehydrogenase [quinone] large subunit